MTSIRALLAAVVLLATPAQAVAAGPEAVPVVMSLADGFTLPDAVPAGWVTFEVRTTDPSPGGFLHYLQGFRTRAGVDPDEVVEDLRRALSPDPAVAAAAIAETGRDAELVGGAAIDSATTVSVTLPLTAGTYWFLDLNDYFVPGQRVTLRRLRVTGSFDGGTPAPDAAIAMRSAGGEPRFVAPARLPADGTFLVANASDEIHELALQRVLPGTTDADLRSFFGGGGAPPFAESDVRGMGSLSPGRIAFLHVDGLVAGSYAMMDFVPGIETGIPHTPAGMHKVVSFDRPAPVPAATARPDPAASSASPR